MIAAKTNQGETAGLSDQELLRVFARDGCDAAFRELVERHLGMVFGVAFRISRNRELAEEAAQNTFGILARKAGRLDSGLIVAAWLHRVAWIETQDLLRRERRRKQIMRTYADNARISQSGVDRLDEKLELLDQAVAELPSQDRDVLVLRFHEQLRLRQIAGRLGITEEASRKRVDRALARLAQFLGKQGVAVSTAVLAANVKTAFGGAAPAGLAALVAEKALTSTLAVTSSGALPYLIFMTHSKFNLFWGTALLLAGTVSFLGGRHAASEFGRAAAASFDDEASITANLKTISVFSRSNFNADQVNTEPNARQILENAVNVVRAAGSSAEAFYRGVLALRDLSADDVPDAIGVLDGIEDNKVIRTLVPLVAGIWAKTDPAAAVAWVERRLHGADRSRLGVAYQKILSKWASNDPQTAYTWYSEKAASGAEGVSINSFRWLPIQIFSGWAEHDPRMALGMLEAVPVEDLRGAISGIVQAHQQSRQGDLLRGYISAMPETRRKAELVEDLASRWAKGSPEAAASWLDTVPLAGAMDRFRAKAEVAEEWIKQDRGALLHVGAWLLAGAPTEMRQEILQALRQEANRMGSGEANRQP